LRHVEQNAFRGTAPPSPHWRCSVIGSSVAVFAKRIPLTDLERRAENVMSTANLFSLSLYCHYGVGSAGGGVWREVAAQQ
jgi:hypothetical protein